MIRGVGMVEVFERKDEGLVKVFFSLKDGKLDSATIGNNSVSKKSGIQFYVEEHVALQLDKLSIYMDGFSPRLELKEGEEIIIPEKSEKEKEIERLKKELERLQEEYESRDED